MNRIAWLCLLGLAAGCNAMQRPGAKPESTGVVTALGVGASFDDAVVGTLPDGWRVAETNGTGTPGAWRIDEERDGSRVNRFVRLAETHNRGATFNVLLSKSEIGADFQLSIRLRADGGTEDRGGGVLWRARGPDDYYVARWNPLEQNLRTYKVERGRRTMLSSVDVAADAKEWHALSVVAHGDEYEISFDGKRVAIVDDATYLSRGRYGFWTKADAATSFDDLKVSWTEETAR